MKKAIGVKEFISIWQGAATKQDVVKKTGFSLGYVTATAGVLRKLGAKDLRKFSRQGKSIVSQAERMDKGELARLAAEALKFTYAK